MYYKPDWEKAQQRIQAWWHHEVIDRCCIAVQAPKTSSKLPPFPDLQLGPWLGGLENVDEDNTPAIEHWWKDPEANYQRMVTWFENTLFAGEALPITYINWGSMALSGILGCPMQFKKTTVRHSPVIQDWDDWHWSFVPNRNPTWKALLAIMALFIKRADGRYLVGPPDLGNGAEVLSLMRGMNRLPVDLIESPQRVKESLHFISDVWISLMEQVHKLTLSVNHNGGVIAWLGLWAPGRTGLLACDISGVISPEMFKTFILPEVHKMGRWCSHGIYHLDGPACMKNTLDILLEVDQIKAIQFSPGIGLAPSYSEAYIPQYRKILRKGKGLFLLVEPTDVEKILSLLPPEGLFLRTYVNSEQEAEDLLNKVTLWTSSGV
ncbi:MAG: hypothetical protein U9R53_11925 [Chloroflexota bacterium]|nr:hypothetical protein [Chloroflexota bacterium]